MMRMSEPNITYIELLQACRDGIERDNALLIRLNEAEEELNIHSESYLRLGQSATLYTMERLSRQNFLVANNLTKEDLKKLYEYYLRQKRSGRKVYDRLLASANEKCPFCGGIGRPRNLDHFVPKAFFPQFYILPLNLIPSCRDCNMDGKGQSFSETAEKQILHPFLDSPHFFEEQWLFARYIMGTGGEPNTIQYYVAPPHTWNDIDKARVRQHFDDFDISIRYAIEASSALIEVEAQHNAHMLVGTLASFKETVLQPSIDSAPFINHWKRVMYIALINDL